MRYRRRGWRWLGVLGGIQSLGLAGLLFDADTAAPLGLMASALPVLMAVIVLWRSGLAVTRRAGRRPSTTRARHATPARPAPRAAICAAPGDRPRTDQAA